jgi:hypothetical protein
MLIDGKIGYVKRAGLNGAHAKAAAQVDAPVAPEDSP